MRDDPYAGLDQQLFRERTTATSQQASKPASLPRKKQATHEDGQPSSQPPSLEASMVAAREASRQESRVPTSTASLEARRPAEASLNGQMSRTRVSSRHTYEIFIDQARWLNRLKLDIEEQLNAEITINSVVSLAIDLIREDYETNRERSQIVRVLVQGLQLDARLRRQEP